MIEIKNLTKIFPNGDEQLIALNKVNLTFEPGEFTAIVGPSGSGKTTLLNLIGGLDTPNEGSVFINQQDISKLSENDLIDFRLHHIGFVFQSYNLIPVLTAIENIEFLMLLQKWPEKDRKERAAYLLEAIGLKAHGHKKPGEMSGGQQQRVAVARALATKPKLILADEPTANLDATSANSLLDLMKSLNESEGVSFLFSTHDDRVIQKVNRIIKMEDGLICE
jgi:putative ABC transport system ATP-binding protein